MDEVILRDTYLYYLFVYDALICVECLLYDMRSNGVDDCCLDHNMWISFPFDLGDSLNCCDLVVVSPWKWFGLS